MIRIVGSHVHPFQENFDWMVGDGVPVADYMRLPVAVPLTPEPEGVLALVTAMGQLFNVEGVEAIPVPPWEPRLL